MARKGEPINSRGHFSFRLQLATGQFRNARRRGGDRARRSGRRAAVLLLVTARPES